VGDKTSSTMAVFGRRSKATNHEMSTFIPWWSTFQSIFSAEKMPCFSVDGNGFHDYRPARTVV